MKRNEREIERGRAYIKKQKKKVVEIRAGTYSGSDTDDDIIIGDLGELHDLGRLYVHEALQEAKKNKNSDEILDNLAKKVN